MKAELTIEGMTCEHCVRAVQNRLARTDGVQVEEVRIGSAVIDIDEQKVSMADIEDAIADEGYTVASAG